MDPAGSELDSSLPEPERPCLIVEDSQPDSMALEDDPESSYRAVLARRLSGLQPAAARSPVLELISSPMGSQSSQSLNNNNNNKVGTGFPVDGQSSDVSSPPTRTRTVSALNSEVDSGADSTTHGLRSEGGTSQFGLLELSQSQDVEDGDENRSRTDDKPAAQPIGVRQSEDPRAVSSSSQSRPLSVQALLHCQNLEEELLSSQDDLFDANKSSTAVDSTVREGGPPGPPTPTPAQTLALLHLSGHATLVQESLSQNSADFVAPTPEGHAPTPLLVPSSPTAPENGGAEEPTDASPLPLLPPSAPHSAAASGRSLSVPSQPELSHDVFVPTASLELQQSHAHRPPLQPSPHSTSQHLDSAAFAPLHLSASTQEYNAAGDEVDDSQATQIQEEGEEPKPANGGAAETEASNPLPGDGPKGADRSLNASAGANGCVPESLVSLSPSVTVVTGGSGLRGGAGGGRSQEAEPRGSAAVAPQPIRRTATNGHQSPPLVKEASDRLSQTEGAGPEAKEKSLSDSSGEISFHFTLPKDGELIGPAVGSSPPSVTRLKQTLRHSTPIENSSFCKTSESPADVTMACGGSGEASDGADGKLSLRMKLVTPVEEGSSERFSLQKPPLSQEEHAVATVTTASQAVTSSPSLSSVFTRVRQVHRKQQVDQDQDPEPLRTELFGSPQPSSQTSSLGCHSLPNSQSEPPQRETTAEPKPRLRHAPNQPPAADRTDNRQGVEPQQATPRKRATPLQSSSTDQSGLHSPAGRVDPESPSVRRVAGPSHRRHVRTVQEVRTTVTRTITDVYYEDGKEVDRRVSEESEEPVVDCQVLDSDVSPCRTGSSLTSGDLADVSSLSSKASGTSSGAGRADFVMPPSRGIRSNSPRRGGGPRQRGQRGHRGHRASTGHAPLGSSSFAPPSPRGRGRRGRPPSRGGAGSLQRPAPLGSPSLLPLSSSEDERIGRMLPPPVPVSPPEPVTPSDSLRSSPDEGGGNSFVGLRVVAKWSSNGYFYSGRIIGDAGEGRFRLRFDDGYECEVAGKDVLLCDPIPLETEVTALLEDEFFSIGVVKGHRVEGQDLFYSVEREGQRQWHNRTAVILSLDQGNRLREQHSLGPYEPATPLTKASDISLDNLVEGKRRRTGTPGGPSTPTRSSSSPQTPGPSSGKRKLTSSKEGRTPAKRGRRGAGPKVAQRVGECNTSGSGSELAAPSAGASEGHGPLPQNPSLFMGFVFMLTASSQNDRLTNRLTGDDEEECVETGPYNKKYTESQLEAGGGFILADFNEEQCKAAYQSLLIADQHCRTRSYLLCLASGVPCVSNVWVQDCCKENKLLNYRNYLLPAGVGADNKTVEWHPRCSPFQALKVLLVFEKPEPLWAQLLSMGGASSVRHFQTEDESEAPPPGGRLDVAVADAACPSAVASRMASQDVPLVSPEWLIQSVICGECVGFHSNPHYRHDYAAASS